MISALRSMVRMLASVAHTVGVVLALSISHLLLGERRWAAVRFRIMRYWGRGMLLITGVRLQTSGRPPAPPFLLISNHLSYLDIMVLASVVNGRFIAKQDIAGWPGLGVGTAAAGTIYVNRENKRDLLRVGTLMEEAYDGGDGVILFGEGTSSPGETVLPLKPSLLAFAARKHLPVYTATLSYTIPGDTTGERARHQACWWDDISLVPHFSRMAKIPHIDATLVFNEEPVSAPNRKELASRLHDTMLSTFRPVGTGGASCAP